MKSKLVGAALLRRCDHLEDTQRIWRGCSASAVMSTSTAVSLLNTRGDVETSE